MHFFFVRIKRACVCITEGPWKSQVFDLNSCVSIIALPPGSLTFFFLELEKEGSQTQSGKQMHYVITTKIVLLCKPGSTG